MLSRADRELILATVPAAVVNALKLWASWMHKDDQQLGYSNHSAGFATGGINCWDDFEESTDDKTAAAVDPVVMSLSLRHRVAINHLFMAAVWSFAREPVKAVCEEAMQVVWRKMVERGVV